MVFKYNETDTQSFFYLENRSDNLNSNHLVRVTWFYSLC